VMHAGKPSAGLAAALLALSSAPAGAQTVEELQRQIDELKAQVKALTEARAAAAPEAAAPADAPVATATAPASPVMPEPVAPPPPQLAQAAPPPTADKPWYERLQLRGYAQIRYNAFLSGDETAPAGISRLRSVQDSSINENGNFSLRRVRIALQGNVTDDIAIYIQPDFATAVNNQSGSERREGFVQLRDAYVDWFLDDANSFRLRIGQMKIPFGWENLQSSSSRIPLDRSDAINSGPVSERDIGIAALYTPPAAAAVWSRLAKDGQKTFGNNAAFAVGVYNGQGGNRTERNGSLSTVAMATWPFALDGLGLDGQVLELGGSVLLNRFRPELRAGGVSAIDYDDERVGIHAILYPQPFGVQAAWNWGRGPEWDRDLLAIREQSLNGGYVQLMYDLGETSLGRIIPYGRWQRYRGGWKASLNAPSLATDELELGLEWRFMKALELTLAFATTERAEADERRTGRAEGSLIRTQLQWSY
jgi:hypothetical protein